MIGHFVVLRTTSFPHYNNKTYCRDGGHVKLDSGCPQGGTIFSIYYAHFNNKTYSCLHKITTIMTKREIAEMLGVSNVRVSVKYSNWDKMIEDINGNMVNVNEIFPYKLLVFNEDTNDLIASGALTHQVYKSMQKGGLDAIDITVFERRQGISLINIKDKTLMEF